MGSEENDRCSSWDKTTQKLGDESTFRKVWAVKTMKAKSFREFLGIFSYLNFSGLEWENHLTRCHRSSYLVDVEICAKKKTKQKCENIGAELISARLAEISSQWSVLRPRSLAASKQGLKLRSEATVESKNLKKKVDFSRFFR